MKILLCFILVYFFVEIKTQVENQAFFKDNSWSTISQTFTQGSINGYYSYNEIKTLFNNYKMTFPDIIQELRIIGNTYNNLPIYSICLYKDSKRILQNDNKTVNISNTSNITNVTKTIENTMNSDNNGNINKSSNFSYNYTENMQNINPLIKDRPNFLITSGFRGSDYISVSMALYIIKYLIYGYVNGDSEVNYLLENRIIWVIPLLNVDSYQYIAEKYTKEFVFSDIEKNRRIFPCDNSDDFGVYLLSNYNYNFYISNDNSQYTDTCSINYRGLAPFSELETLAHNSFIKSENFKMAFNFMNLRNCIFVPFNTFGENATFYYQNNDKVYNLFQKFAEKAYLPTNSYFGTLYDYSKQINSGDPSDYLYNQLGIVNFNIELGGSNIDTAQKFPKTKNILPILDNYLNYTLYCLVKSGEYFTVSVDAQKIANCDSSIEKVMTCNNDNMVYLLRVNISNQGLNDSSYERLIEFNMGKYITLQKVFHQSSIYSADIIEDYQYFTAADMSYEGVTMSNESIYNLKISNLQLGNSLIFALFGYISDYQQAYQTNIYIKDLAALNSNLFLKATVQIEDIQSSYQVNDNTNKQNSDETIPRKQSIILIIVYTGMIFSLFVISFVKCICF